MYNVYQDTIVITNRFLVNGDFLEQIKKVTSLHPYALILRERDLEDAAYAGLARQIASICENQNVSFFVHSKAELALNFGYEKIHMPIRLLENNPHFVKEFKQVSVSCHSLEEVQKAMELHASQIILGTIFKTDCKKGLEGKGLVFLEEACQHCNIPVYAIGGIQLERIPELKKKGAAGGCMMSGFMRL